MRPMKYKGYAAHIAYSDQDGCLVGRVVGIRDVIGFHGDCVEEIRADFHAAVESYLASCKEQGRSPDKPYSGKFVLRLTPETHARAAAIAQAHGKSLNAWAAAVIEEAAL